MNWDNWWGGVTACVTFFFFNEKGHLYLYLFLRGQSVINLYYYLEYKTVIFHIVGTVIRHF